MSLPAILLKNIGNLRQSGDSPSGLSALLLYKLRFASKMYLFPELKRGDYNWNDKIHPINLSIETTSKCNSECVMCPRTMMGLKAYEPVRDELLNHETVLDLIKRTPHSIFNPSGFGEPLLDPHVPEYITTAHDSGRLTRVVTNASLLSNLTAERLMFAGLDLFILSIDAADKETYERIRRGLKWEQTASNIMNLKEIRDHGRYRTYIQVNIVINSINKKEIQRIVDYWYPHVDNIRTLKEARYWKKIPNKIPVRKCFAPWEVMIIFSNGDVPVCCRDVEGEYIFGNILKNSPMEVWNSKKAKDFRRRLLSDDPPKICQHCEIPIVDEYYPDRTGQMIRINTIRRELA